MILDSLKEKTIQMNVDFWLKYYTFSMRQEKIQTDKKKLNCIEKEPTNGKEQRRIS